MPSLLRPTVVAVLAASATTFAQPPAAPATRPALAASAAASGNSLGYRSVFQDYRGFTDQPVTSWRDANDLVGRIGGWQTYARESQGVPAVASQAPAASASAPTG